MKQYITAEQAISVLPDGDSVHTFYNPSFGLVGGHWHKADITDKLYSSIIELTGKRARGMGHGICVHEKNARYQGDILFIETDEDRLAALERELEGGENGNKNG